MQALCLSNDLVAEYLNFRQGKSFNKSLIEKLLRHLQPALVSICQHSAFKDPSLPNQFSGDPIIKLDSVPDGVSNAAEHLVKHTSLKLQLVTKKDEAVSYTQLNIQALSENFERLNLLLAGAYSSASYKEEAISHIRALISDAKVIKITDKYIHKDGNWPQCKSVLEQILPKNDVSLKIIADSFDKHSELQALCSDWKVKAEQIRPNIHDRYIETDRLKIMLSSGVFHLSTSSATDLTYVVKIK